MQTVQVQVPDGVEVGSTFSFMTLSGEQMQAQSSVPSGQIMQVNVPAAPVMATAPMPVVMAQPTVVAAPQPMLGAPMPMPHMMPQGPAMVDTTGDGRADSVVVDSTGDGRLDRVVPLQTGTRPAAPSMQQMARNGGAASKKHMSAQRLELSLASHPGQAVVVDDWGFCPWVPCVPYLICCCMGDLTLGPEDKAMKVDWNPDSCCSGNLTYVDGYPRAAYPRAAWACCLGSGRQHIHVADGKYEAENRVLLFGCLCPSEDYEQFALYSDGTIRARPRPDLAIGLQEVKDGEKQELCLVKASSSRRLVFKHVLDGR